MTYTEAELNAIVQRHREAWRRAAAPRLVLVLACGLGAGFVIGFWLA